MELSVGRAPSMKEYIDNLEAKMKVSQFLQDMDGIVRPGFNYDPFAAFETVKEIFISNL